MFRLERLKIGHFRGFKPGTMLEFSRGLNVLLGRNGTGKSTLLELISDIRTGSFDRYITEPFEFEYNINTAKGSIVVLASHKPVPVSDRLDRLEDGESQTPFRFELSLSISPIQTDTSAEVRSLEVRSHGRGASAYWLDAPQTKKTLEVVSVMEGSVYFAALVGLISKHTPEDTQQDDDLSEDEDDVEGDKVSSDPNFEGAVQALISCIGASQRGTRFDESLDWYRRMLGESQVRFRRATRRRAPVPGRITGLIPNSVVESLGRSYHADPTLESLSVIFPRPEGQGGRFELALGLLGATSISYTVKLTEKKVDTSVFGGASFRLTREDGSIVSQDHLSYGEKRILAFLWYMEMATDVAVVDELVNGLHHSWIEACVNALAGLQVFLTSQNPLLMDFLSFASAEDVRNSFMLSSYIDTPERQINTRSMDNEEAASFFSAYEVGIQTVSELLRERGLW